MRADGPTATPAIPFGPGPLAKRNIALRVPDYVRIARRNVLLIFAILILAVSAGALITLWERPTYQSTAKLYVALPVGGSVDELAQASSYVQQTVKTYADIATTEYVLAGVKRRLDLGLTVDELTSKVSARAVPDETIIMITVLDTMPRRAAAIANGLSAELGRAVAALTPPSNAADSLQVQALQTANVATQPTSPSWPFNLTIALIIGLAAAVIASALREGLDTRLKNEAEITDVAQAPVLGSLAYDALTKTAPLVFEREPNGRLAEAYRKLEVNLEHLLVREKPVSCVVTSSRAGVGKSTVAANLSMALSLAGRSVLVVDADFRRPKISAIFNLKNLKGLSDVLVERLDLDEAFQAGPLSGLTVLTTGPTPPNPTELLQTSSMTALIAELEQRFDVVIFDAPPLLPVADGSVLTKATAGAILVCAYTRTRRQDLDRASRSLRQIRADLLGVVLNMVPARDDMTTQYGYASPQQVSRPGLLMRVKRKSRNGRTDV